MGGVELISGIVHLLLDAKIIEFFHGRIGQVGMPESLSYYGFRLLYLLGTDLGRENRSAGIFFDPGNFYFDYSPGSKNMDMFGGQLCVGPEQQPPAPVMDIGGQNHAGCQVINWNHSHWIPLLMHAIYRIYLFGLIL